MNSVFANTGIVASLVVVVIASGIFFLNNVSIRYNMLLLHRILIQYCLNLQINMFTTYMNANFNKMLETLIFQRSYAQHLYQKHIP